MVVIENYLWYHEDYASSDSKIRREVLVAK